MTAMNLDKGGDPVLVGKMLVHGNLWGTSFPAYEPQIRRHPKPRARKAAVDHDER
jgi:hypothetical protein